MDLAKWLSFIYRRKRPEPGILCIVEEDDERRKAAVQALRTHLEGSKIKCYNVRFHLLDFHVTFPHFVDIYNGLTDPYLAVTSYHREPPWTINMRKRHTVLITANDIFEYLKSKSIASV